MPANNATSWERLNQLVLELWEAIPAPARNAELHAELAKWQDAYAQSQSGFGLADSALAWWVDHYNVLRDRVKGYGLDVPPRAQRSATWDENLVEAAQRGIVDPALAAAGGVGFGALLAIAAVYMMSQGKGRK